MKDWRKAPVLGAGLGFRREVAARILRACDDIPVVELLADAFVDKSRSEVDDLSEVFALVPHGVSLSLASTDCLDDDAYLSKLRELCRGRDFPYYSDHVALTKAGGAKIGHLSPVWRTREQLRVLSRNVAAVQEILGLPLVLENVAALFEIPGAQMSEPAFINEVVQKTGCGVLLDLENLRANELNLGVKAAAWLRELDLDCVAQIHLAGGRQSGDYWIDSHSRPVPDIVWRLYEEIAPRCAYLKCVIVERDEGLSGFGRVLEEVRRAGAVFDKMKVTPI